MRDVTENLLPDKAKSDELEVFLASGGASSQRGRRRVEYFGGCLVVLYDKRHDIASIEVSDDFGVSRLKRLECEVAEALSEDGVEVRQRYLFSHVIVDSAFRYKNDFQILPPPPDSPRPNFLHAAHPFLLEFSISRSPDWRICNHRAEKRCAELSLLLNALIRYLRLPIGSASHEWVYMAEPKWTSQYLQLGYHGGKKEWAKGADGFSDISEFTEMQIVDSKAYYAALGVESGKPFQLPDMLLQSIEAYETLDSGDKAKFCRASYWAQVSLQVFTVSQSASFAALVSAVEVFLPDPEKCKECGRPTSSEICGTCNQPTAGPTKQFRDFVDEFAPGISLKDRSQLYSRRSSLSHGSSLLPGDMSEIGFRFTPHQDEVWRERMMLSLIVQLVLVNWVNKPS